MSTPGIGLRLATPQRHIDEQLGAYELVRELAFGRLYSVYLARSVLEPESKVVIKRLRSAAPDAHARGRILREARVGLGLRVPQLARVREVHDDPELFLVMEYVEGTKLSELLARARGADVMRYVVPVLLDALRALSALHGWRDENGAPGFLVHQAPSPRHLLVGLDGLTRLLDLSNVHGRLLGTVPSQAYSLWDSELAPEQAAHTPIDPRCDLYIVGTILRHALTQSGRADLDGLLEVCSRATAERASERYWSADEMAHALQVEASERALIASQDEVAKWARSLRAGPIAATATVPRVRAWFPPPAPSLAHLVLPQPACEHVEATEVVAPPRRSRVWIAGLALAVASGASMYGLLSHTQQRVVTTPIARAEPVVTPPRFVAVPVIDLPKRTPVVTPTAAIPTRPKVRTRPKRALVAAQPVEEELQLYQPEVLFYDEEKPDEAPRLGVPGNPF